jgi:alkylation response protein AidB-like acyl-CoA dehydrogenase
VSVPCLNFENLNWLLFDVLKIESLLDAPRYQDYDKQSLAQFLDSTRRLAEAELGPVFREMDAKPAYWQDGKVICHPAVGTMMQRAGELGLIGAILDNEVGGIQLPFVLFQAAQYVIDAYNNHVSGYFGLTAGAAGLIATFGSDQLKETYLPKMLEGTWAGTMALTETQAGSSLSDIVTQAVPREDGAYDISGQKIWISGGDHEYCENFVHLALARIQGAPAGTKGISLFAVPKYRVEDGKLVPNDVFTAGDFQKMGQRGYSTTHLIFGEKNNCRGWLVGQAHQGLGHMFMMMNGARISVGRHGAAISSAAYYASLQFAKERPQGRRLQAGGAKKIDEAQTLIINHPDVRRMLLTQKAITEGALALVMQASYYHDREQTTEGEESKRYNQLLELLTPMVKTYPSEAGRRAVDNGVQVLGGAGFCDEYVLQVYYRDVRIMSIYEGTTGIQSLDLLGRKIFHDGGKALGYLGEEVKETLVAAGQVPELLPYVTQLQEQLKLNKEVLAHLGPLAMQGEHERALSDATLYMEFLSNIVVAWLWLKMGVTALSHTDAAFRDSKLHTMKFFFTYELARNRSLADILRNTEQLTIVGANEVLI